jgi:glycosyltransferase involved in cell wall biosynthesis
VWVLTCWKQATEYARAHGVRDPLETGISIAPCFAYTGEPKYEYAAAYMPRRGAKLCNTVRSMYSTLRYFAIEGMNEDEVARVMKHSSIYLATAEHEGFGLTALEAMSAGCVVVSVPVVGGMEYLNNGINCRVAGPQDFAAVVGELLQERSAVMRFRMRQAAVATARRYTIGRMMQRLSALFDGPLSSWRRGA